LAAARDDHAPTRRALFATSMKRFDEWIAGWM